MNDLIVFFDVKNVYIIRLEKIRCYYGVNLFKVLGINFNYFYLMIIIGMIKRGYKWSFYLSIYIYFMFFLSI